MSVDVRGVPHLTLVSNCNIKMAYPIVKRGSERFHLVRILQQYCWKYFFSCLEMHHFTEVRFDISYFQNVCFLKILWGFMRTYSGKMQVKKSIVSYTWTVKFVSNLVQTWQKRWYRWPILWPFKARFCISRDCSSFNTLPLFLRFFLSESNSV